MALILVELASGTYIYLNRDSSKNAADRYLHQWIHEYEGTPNAKAAIDNIQSRVSEIPVFFFFSFFSCGKLLEL